MCSLLLFITHCFFLGSLLGEHSALRELLDELGNLLVQLQPHCVTIKWHCFLKHIQDHEIEYGPIYTTEVFEREHRNFMTSLNQQTTNCESTLPMRYIAGQYYKRKMKVITKDNATNMGQFMVKSVHNEKFRKRKLESDSNLVPWKELTKEHTDLLTDLNAQPDWKLRKRIHVETRMGSFVFTSSSYWGSKTRTASLVSFTDPKTNAIGFGLIEIIFTIADISYILVKEFILEPFSITFLNIQESNLSDVSQKVLDLCKRFPLTFSKTLGFQMSVVPVSHILCPASTILIHNDTYMSRRQLQDAAAKKVIKNSGILYQQSGSSSSTTNHMDNSYATFQTIPDNYGEYLSRANEENRYHPHEVPFSSHIPDQLRNVKLESPHYPSTPSRKRPQQVDLRGSNQPQEVSPSILISASLDGSIKNGKLDILSAGRALHNAYQSGQYGIPEDVESFLTKHSLDVPLPKLPQPVFTGLTPEAGALLHGYGIVAQLSLNAVQKLLSEQKSTKKISGEQLFGISDAPFAVKLRCNYPDFPPFSGSQIDMDSIPLMDASFPTHVRLQNYLFDILGKSCTVQTDIQRFWLIPGERKMSYGTPSPFPKELYDNLYKLFLEFFQLDDQLFDEPEYRSEFGNLRLLKNYATEEAKKKKFVQVSSAKKTFRTNTFRAQFKNALKELRLGTFIIADGSSQGYFARRKRHIAKSKAHEAGEEEEES
ncbi:hypothetical protein L3Y34_009332 [Caenorhabditis briggsae]|uniref:Uncharacterized protein n=1 Tax=Caenorhabditis briggsae TaxID=6238 RepID=A0AAE9AA08_CAEBR|nr:hypothetical protein L3Y34_009332 [Caenorhabditis briggsae]